MCFVIAAMVEDSLVLRRWMKSLNCCVAPYDLLMSSSSRRNRPALVFTLDKTVYSQFFQQFIPQPVTIIFSRVRPCSLCPVTASARLMGNCVILVLNISGGVFSFIEHFTVVLLVIGCRWNTLLFLSDLIFCCIF